MEHFAGSSPDAWALADRGQDAWLAFACGGSPCHGGLAPWPAYEPASRATMLLGRECGIEDAPREPECRVWDAIL